jgi:hypothetical protein
MKAAGGGQGEFAGRKGNGHDGSTVTTRIPTVLALDAVRALAVLSVVFDGAGRGTHGVCCGVQSGPFVDFVGAGAFASLASIVVLGVQSSEVTGCIMLKNAVASGAFT